MMLMPTHLSDIYYICRSLRRGASCGRWPSLGDSSAVSRAEKMDEFNGFPFFPLLCLKIGIPKTSRHFFHFFDPQKVTGFFSLILGILKSHGIFPLNVWS